MWNLRWERETAYLIRHRNWEYFFLGANQANAIWLFWGTHCPAVTASAWKLPSTGMPTTRGQLMKQPNRHHKASETMSSSWTHGEVHLTWQQRVGLWVYLFFWVFPSAPLWGIPAFPTLWDGIFKRFMPSSGRTDFLSLLFFYPKTTPKPRLGVMRGQKSGVTKELFTLIPVPKGLLNLLRAAVIRFPAVGPTYL